MNCFDCAHARFCETWGELKCLEKKHRIYKILGEDTCEDFKKRDKGIILDTPCQCEHCTALRGSKEDE